MPSSTFAVAGPGNGGGGTSGCSVPPNTCYGAVWRYRTTNSNSVQIPNVRSGLGGGGSTSITGCAASGGYFEYVLVTNANNPDTNNNNVRSWKIGVNAGETTHRSEYFGGATNYRINSYPSDTLPSSLTNGGNYSWYAVEKAFAQTVALNQNNGYQWNGNSTLGWFCYASTNYNLTPTISTSPTSAVTAGGTVNAIGAVSNAGPTSSSSTNWQITQFTVASGTAIPAGGDSSQIPTTFYRNGATVIGSGSGTYPLNTTSLSPVNSTVPDMPVGTRVCYALSVQPYSQTTTDWRHSTPACVVIAKKPLVQVLGGDLRVGAAFIGGTTATSNIQTSVTIKTNTSYGSWGEYGLIASGSIIGMASGSAYSGGLPCTSTCAVNNISFTNSGSTIGQYKDATNIPDVASSFAVTPTTPQFGGLGDAAQQRVETSSNNIITIPGGMIQKGQWLVINAPTKTVRITGDITYANTPLQAIGDIPQLIIIADQINIEGNVKTIDAWLIASGPTGAINTCSAWGGVQLAVNAPLSSTMCNNTLLVDGPVMAKTLYLRRTAGADNAAQSGVPAETFNFRPDAYLWSAAQAAKSSANLETTYTAELPPRF